MRILSRFLAGWQAALAAAFFVASTYSGPTLAGGLAVLLGLACILSALCLWRGRQ